MYQSAYDTMLLLGDVSSCSFTAASVFGSVYS